MLRFAAMRGISDIDQQQLQTAAEKWLALGLPQPKVWLVAGSGLSGDLGVGTPDAELKLQQLLPFAVRAVVGHPHSVSVFADSVNGPVAYQQGRLHLYQGYSAAEVAFTVRLAATLGAKTLIMSNAAGSLRPEIGPGSLAVITDHLNLTGQNPLVGSVPPGWGPQFPDMTTAYDPALVVLAKSLAKEQGLSLPSGTYAGLLGPTYETPAEVRMVGTIGGDLVGMSTVTEVIAAHHMGLRCLCFSMVSNLGAGMTDNPLHHDEVLEAAAETTVHFATLLRAILANPALTASTP